jgi:heme/copper-type cytochrome/quinol oxidase subunit 2
MSDVLDWLVRAYLAMPLVFRVLFPVAVAITVVDQVWKRVAPDSRGYAAFKHGLESIGAFWTAVILSIVYFLSVSLVNLFLRLKGEDPLDRQLAPAPTFWKIHEPNPLGALRAARHQF